jgi:hypothetical protein
VQQEVTSSGVERGHNSRDGIALGCGQLVGLWLARNRVDPGGSSTLSATSSSEGRNESERASGCRPVVVGEPERELDESGRNPIENRPCIGDLDARRSCDVSVDDDSTNTAPAEANRHHGATPDIVRHPVGERSGQRTGRNERVDLREGH